MTKKALDEKYFYQIDERNVVHLFREEESCQQYLTNPLLSAIFKIENLEKENAELKKKNLDAQDAVTMQMYTNKANKEIADEQLTKATDIIKRLLDNISEPEMFSDGSCEDKDLLDLLKQAEKFISDIKEG